MEPHTRRWVGCNRISPHASCTTRGLRTKTQKGARGASGRKDANRERAPPPGHARPRRWVRWNCPRVVGWGAIGSPRSGRAPRAACFKKVRFDLSIAETPSPPPPPPPLSIPSPNHSFKTETIELCVMAQIRLDNDHEKATLEPTRTVRKLHVILHAHHEHAHQYHVPRGGGGGCL